jgi:hypothetical protein
MTRTVPISLIFDCMGEGKKTVKDIYHKKIGKADAILHWLLLPNLPTYFLIVQLFQEIH